MADWDAFDSQAYVNQNYGRGILPEDGRIMRFAVDALRELDIPPNGIRTAADVGAGPNLYPGLLLTPYLAEDGSLELIDRSAANLSYLRDAVTNNPPAVWREFEENLRRLGHPTSLRKLRAVATVRAGSIFELPAARYDAVMCFFVAESITADRDEFAAALGSLLRSLRPGGVFVTAHMVGSAGYDAGPGVHFPACDLSMAEIEKAYLPYGEFRSVLTSHDDEQAARPGYHGMAAFVGRKTV